MDAFKTYDTDVGITYLGQNYDFPHWNSFVVDDPQMNKIIRGANAKNKVGLVYQEGGKDPKTITIEALAIPIALMALLLEIWEKKQRCDVFGVSRETGSMKSGKNCVLSSRPQQSTIDESPESMNVTLVFETFDIEETYKA